MIWSRRQEKKQVESIDILTYDCIGCGACVSRCRQNVLDLVTNGFCLYAVVANPDACVGCGKCMKACPVGAVELLLA